MENVYAPVVPWILSNGNVTVPKCGSLWIAFLNAAIWVLRLRGAGDKNGSIRRLEGNVVHGDAVRRGSRIDIGDHQIIIIDLRFCVGDERDRLVECGGRRLERSRSLRTHSAALQTPTDDSRLLVVMLRKLSAKANMTIRHPSTTGINTRQSAQKIKQAFLVERIHRPGARKIDLFILRVRMNAPQAAPKRHEPFRRDLLRP